MKEPLVSIIIPAYNSEIFIEETIYSVISQSYSKIECIVIDDGSTDRTDKIVKKLQLKDSRILYFRQVNQGVSSARNRGIKISKGEYVCFLDADDVWLPNRINKMVSQFTMKNKEIGLIHSDIAYINSDSKLTGEINRGLSGEVLDDLLLWEKCVIPAPSSIIVRREAIKKIGLFNEKLSNSADQEFFFRLTSKFSILRIPEILGKYRVHNDNMSKNVSLIEKDQILAYKIASNLGLFKSNIFKKKCYSNMYLTIAACHWYDAKNYRRGLLFIWKAIITYPPNINKIYAKLIKIIK